MTLDELLAEIGREECRMTLDRAPMASQRQGAVWLYVAAEDLYDLIVSQPGIPPHEARERAIQIAAMAARFVLDVCEEKQ